MLSSRRELDESLLREHCDLSWDWATLSKRHHLSWDTIIILEAKTWDWTVLSSRKDLEWETVIELENKPWDWDLLSKHRNVSWNTILQLNEKPWNWTYLSKRDDLAWSTVDSFSDKDWDWTYISKLKNLDWGTVARSREKPWDWAHIAMREDLCWRLVAVAPSVCWGSLLSGRDDIRWDIVAITARTHPMIWKWKRLSRHTSLTKEYVLRHMAFPWKGKWKKMILQHAVATISSWYYDLRSNPYTYIGKKRLEREFEEMVEML